MSESGISANRLELLQIADAVARDKSIDKNIVISAMEDAIQKAAKTRYGSENEIHAEIDPKTGQTNLARLLEVVEFVENKATEIDLKAAKKKNKEAEIGDFISEELPPIEFGRIAAQSAKQVIFQKVRDAERDRQYDEFKDKINEVISGIVKRVEYGNVIVDLGRNEAIIRRDDLLPRESFRSGDRVLAYIQEVRREQRGPQIFLSRTNNNFMAKLFMQEVPEIYDGIVEIIAVARDPGSRAKIAVHTSENSIDPVGACVGMRGSRVQSVVNELQGEKIDIVKWSPDIATFVISSLAPAEATKVVLDEEIERIEVVVPDDHLSLAIGRRGQNVRLASQLTKWDIDILTEAEESERRQSEFNEKSEIFIKALDVDEVIAQLLVSEGFLSIEDLIFVEISEISSIEGFDDDTAIEIQSRAKAFIEEENLKQDTRRKELGVLDDLEQIDGMTTSMLVTLGENNIKTLDDFAGCSTDELFGWVEKTELGSKKQNGLFTGFDIPMEKIEEMILNARLKLGWIAELDESNTDIDDTSINEVEDKKIELSEKLANARILK
ncbi:MAG: transcription termination/antitermination protein NusA [Rhodobiaceae bacterium]|nr:transcription termination/antitermination protein NusA [Rhodobiaceae bacterium]RZO33612.1 MAG: transcription termination/antitermination protein NusA [Hyphomicrobiales bacterium]|tara:strand:- start:7529 stop:9187 length:1659 start_codon:yes stop_codon:yes gene_type:complete